MFTSLTTWLTEQELKNNHSAFLFEWIFTFTLAFLFWSLLFFKIEDSFMSVETAAAMSILYASCLVYVRLFPMTGCKKCSSLLPLIRKEIGRRHIQDEDRCVEIEYGSEAYCRHYIDQFNRTYRVDKVRFRCRRCKRDWEEIVQYPVSNYQYLRTIDFSD